jgi:hypothetical protein
MIEYVQRLSVGMARLATSRRSENLAAAADGDRRHARRDQPIAERLSRLIGAAGCHRYASLQSQRIGGIRQQRPRHIRRLDHIREQIGGQVSAT